MCDDELHFNWFRFFFQVGLFLNLVVGSIDFVLFLFVLSSWVDVRSIGSNGPINSKGSLNSSGKL